MKFKKLSTDECMECENHHRTSDFRDERAIHIAQDGEFFDTGYWFCSSTCYRKAVRPFLDKRYDFDADVKSDPEISAQFKKIWDGWSENVERSFFAGNPRESQEEYTKRLYHPIVHAWYDCQTLAISRAETEVEQRIMAELLHRFEQDHAKKLEELEESSAQFQKEKEEYWTEKEKLKPKEIPFEIQFEHCDITAPTRGGKSTLIHKLFLENIKGPNRAAWIIIDPKGTLVSKISKLAQFAGPGKEFKRVVYIDPSAEFAPALGMFQLPKNAPPSYVNNLIEIFSYIFSSAGSPLTPRQSIPFTYVVRLVFHMGGDLHTLMDVLDDDPKTRRFKKEMDDFSLTDPGAKRFFERDFYSKDFDATKQQIKTRVYFIISKPILNKIMGSSHNNLSLYDCIQEGRIVLVNTSLATLAPEGSTLLGRYIIAMTVAAAMSRIGREVPPVFLAIDEFQDFADEYQTPRMLRLLAEYRCGCILSHQSMHCTEFNESIRTAISTNTAIKYAANPEAADLSYLAQDLRCTKEFLQQQQKSAVNAYFACYVRNIGLKHPFVVEVPLGYIESQPQSELYDRYFTYWTKNLSKAADPIHDVKQPETQKAPEGAKSADVQTAPAKAVTLTDKLILPQMDSDPSKPTKWG